jgi:hypothetical protein
MGVENMKRVMMATMLLAGAAMGETVTDLSGAWRFQRDDAKAGVEEKWFERSLQGDQTIRLPGTMDEGKLGIPNPKAPNLDDLYRPNVYEGAAWYEREIEIPDAWRGQRVTLFLERCRWVTQVWLDGKSCGDPEDSLVTPHVHLLGVGLEPGKHRLTIRNDNTKQIDLGRFVSALYGGTPGNLNGIVGKIELRATPPVWIEDVQVYPDAAAKTARVKVRIGNATGEGGAGRFQVSGVRCRQEKTEAPVTWGPEGGEVVLDVPLKPDTPAWDEFNPAVVTLDLTLTPDTRHLTPHALRACFGLRDFAARGTQFAINGRPLFLRGTLECQVFPLTGYPPCDVPSWQRIYRIIKSYGLNHMRFHSWCPPEAAFAAADLEGIYLQAEAPQANVSAGSDPRRDAFTEAELHRIVRAYGNHPSFCTMTLGNEYGGKDEVLSRWVQMLIDEDPRHLYSSASAAQTTANRQWTETPAGRGVHGPGTAHDVRGVVAGESRPVIGHEIGQWTFFPDFDEMKKYTGVMQPRNFEIVREDLEKRGMLDQAKAFFRATGAQAVLLYKEEIELLLRTPGYAGFSLLDLHDYPSQGTALIGPLDPFWDSKGFVTPRQHSGYCGPTVPLLRMPKRTYTAAETFTGSVEVAHFGPVAFRQTALRWSIEDEGGHPVAAGRLEARDVPTGQLTALGDFTASLAKAAAPCKLKVLVSIDGTQFQNEWEIWVYPDAPAPAAPVGIVVARQWDEAAKIALADGKSVLLLPGKNKLRKALPGRFLPVFWSPVWFPSQKPNTMGILCDPRHPLFKQFPTESYSNWQWWDLINNSSSIILDDTPLEFRPTVQVIDNFARNHKLGNVLEARVGKGRLLVCAIDVEKDLAARPAARQFAKCLYAYVASGDFRPRQELDVATLDALFGASSSGLAGRFGAAAEADSQNADYPAENAIDGDPDTIWHTQWEPSPAPLPHHLIVDLQKPVALAGLIYLPRQDMANGRIADYAIYVSNDRQSWGEPVGAGRWPDGRTKQIVRFEKPLTARFLKLVATSEVGGNAFAAVAELDLVPAQGDP